MRLVNCESSIILLKKIEKVKDFSFINTPEMPDVCLSFVLLFTIFIIVVTQKLVLQQSKKRHSKLYGNPIAPSFYSILLGLKYIIFALKVTNSDINISIIFSVLFAVIISIFIFDLSACLLVTIWPDFYLNFF